MVFLNRSHFFVVSVSLNAIGNVFERLPQFLVLFVLSLIVVKIDSQSFRYKGAHKADTGGTCISFGSLCLRLGNLKIEVQLYDVKSTRIDGWLN